MATLSNYTRDKFLDYLNGAGTQTAPTALYVVLRSVSGGTTDATNREVITFTFDGVANTLTSNIQIEFANHSGGSVTMDRWALYDTLSANTGNEICLGALNSSLVVANGDKVRINVGDVVVSDVGGELSDTYAELVLTFINGTDLIGTITTNVEISDTAVIRGDQPLGGVVTAQILQNAAQITYGSAPAAGTIDLVRFHDGTNTISQKVEAIAYANNDDLISEIGAIKLTVT